MVGRQPLSDTAIRSAVRDNIARITAEMHNELLKVARREDDSCARHAELARISDAQRKLASTEAARRWSPCSTLQRRCCGRTGR
jgi:hypothetical protein